MSYVTDSLGWSERVRMENGSQSSQQDYELGRSNPNHMSQYRDIMQRSQQNFRVITENNQGTSPIKAQRQFGKNAHETSQKYFKNSSPKPIIDQQQQNNFRTINHDDQMSQSSFKQQRPMSASTKSAYIRKGTMKKQNVSRKLNFSSKMQQQAEKNHQTIQHQAQNPINNDQRFNEDLQSVRSYRSKYSTFKFKLNNNGSASNNHQRNNPAILNSSEGMGNIQSQFANMVSLKSMNQKRLQSANKLNRRNEPKYLRNSSQILSQRDYKSSQGQNLDGGLSQRKLANMSQVTQSQNFQDQIKQRIIERVQNLEPEELLNLKETLRIEDEEGLQLQSDEYQQDQRRDGQYQDQSPKFSNRNQHQNQGQDTYDEVASVYSKATRSSLRTIGDKSMRSSRTYASQLEHKLEKEKEARQKLEREVEELKRISSAITTQIGWNNNSQKHQLFQTNSKKY
eukprot:403338264